MSANINPEDNERWLTDGNRAFCRRKSYCSKPCTRQKRRRNAIMRAIIRDRTGIDRVQKLIAERDGQ